MGNKLMACCLSRKPTDDQKDIKLKTEQPEHTLINNIEALNYNNYGKASLRDNTTDNYNFNTSANVMTTSNTITTPTGNKIIIINTPPYHYTKNGKSYSKEIDEHENENQRDDNPNNIPINNPNYNYTNAIANINSSSKSKKIKYHSNLVKSQLKKMYSESDDTFYHQHKKHFRINKEINRKLRLKPVDYYSEGMQSFQSSY